MAHAVHQLTQVGTLIRRKLITRVTQVVKVNRREPCRPERRCQTRRQKLLRLSGPPPELVNTSPSSPGADRKSVV